MSVRLSHSFKLLLPFCFSTESSHFWPSVLQVAHYKTFFFDFCLRPPNAQNLLPKICTKSPISRLVWQIDRRCFGLPGVFGDGRFNGTMQNVLGPTLVAMATKFRLFLHKIAYKSAYMAERQEMFGPTRGFRGWPIQWNHAKCCGAATCCHGNEIWARRGDPVAYRLVIPVSQLIGWKHCRWLHIQPCCPWTLNTDC